MSLSTIIAGPSVVGIVLSLGKSIITEGIQLTTRGMIFLLETNPQLSTFTEPIDLDAELKVIDAMVETLQSQIIIESTPYKALWISLTSLRDSLDKVHIILGQLDKEIKYHDTIYFKNWRTPRYLHLITSLQIHWHRVLSRKTTLLQTISYLANTKIIGNLLL